MARKFPRKGCAQADLFNKWSQKSGTAAGTQEATGPPTIEPIAAPAKDAPRLSVQNQKVLAALQQGPNTNAELAAVALKYTSRISDLSNAGYNIPPPRDLGGGVKEYTLLTSKEK